ncbi:DUF4123 domain-containing protein [Novosphingobium sp.]|uniref:DUF4123 domain-containing protein n=1 Tax=Novosphingobium sp. TaxID=1874826 RepID=UPI003B51F371
MASRGPAWYAIIDGSRDPRLEALVGGCRDHICLFKGRLDPQLSQVAPWLVRIHESEPLLGTWQQHGRGLAWGMMVYSSASLVDLQRFFRRFLQARLPDGMVALFRFYDPRVFNTYIRAALPEERAPWFAQVQQYAVESADGTALHQYRLSEGHLWDGNSAIG